MTEGDVGLWAAAITTLIIAAPIATGLTVRAVWRKWGGNDESPRH